jgi:hypothetical protein
MDVQRIKTLPGVYIHIKCLVVVVGDVDGEDEGVTKRKDRFRLTNP